MSRLVRRTSSRLPVHATSADLGAMRHEPVLIGPPCAGKSTIAQLLAERSGRPVVCLDALSHTLLPVLGCDLERAEALARSGDHSQWCRYVRPFEHLMLEWVLDEHRDAVFDVGAGFVLPIDHPRHLAAGMAPAPRAASRPFERPARRPTSTPMPDECVDATVDAATACWLPRAVSARLASFGAVVHVTPSLQAASIERHCLERLVRRHGRPAPGDDWMLDVGRYYACRSAAYARLATFEVWTGQETPVQSVERIEAFMAGLACRR